MEGRGNICSNLRFSGLARKLCGSSTLFKPLYTPRYRNTYNAPLLPICALFPRQLICKGSVTETFGVESGHVGVDLEQVVLLARERYVTTEQDQITGVVGNLGCIF